MNKYTLKYTLPGEEGPRHFAASFETDDLDLLHATELGMDHIHQQFGYDTQIIFRSIELENAKEAYERIATV